jgi:hypothetical protein
MKSSASIAISLTLLMFILVLSAAVFFLFQEQQTLQGELSTSEESNKDLRSQQAEMELDGLAVQATLETVQNLQATAAVENLTLEGQLSTSANANATLEALSTEQSSALDAINATISIFDSQGPAVNIVQPQAGTNLFIDQTVEIIIVATDPNGVTTVSYNINEEFFSEEFEESPVVTLRQIWTPTELGTFIINASAVNSNEITSPPSQFSTATFTVIEPPPTPTNTPEPTEEPTPES